MKPSMHDIIEWARTAWPRVFRGPDPLYNGYVEFAELAYAAGRKAGMEEAARIIENQETYGDHVGNWFETLVEKIRAAMEADK